MKIMNVMFTTRNGGIEQVFLDYNTSFLNLSKHELVSVVHSNSAIFDSLTGTYHKLYNFSKYDPIALVRFTQIIKKEKPDLLITHGNRAHYMSRAVVGNQNIKIIGVSHNYSFDQLPKCDHIIAITKTMRANIISQGFLENRVHCLPNMIKIPEECVYSPKKLRSTPIIGVLARIDKIKGIDVLIHSLSLLVKETSNFKVKIAGSGPEIHNIQKLIVDYNLQDRIELVGWIKNKKEFFDNIDILCAPSRSEPFGLVILEAFMNSVPVIASDSLGPTEIIKHGEDGLIFDNGNVQHLKDTILTLIYNQQLAQNLARQAFLKLQNYSMKNIGNKLVEISEKVLG